MLFDPLWIAKPSVPSIIDFLATKPADQVYDFSDGAACAAAQYMDSIGWRADKVDRHSALGLALPGAYMWIFFHRPRTFGAALERARRFQP